MQNQKINKKGLITSVIQQIRSKIKTDTAVLGLSRFHSKI